MRFSVASVEITIAGTERSISSAARRRKQFLAIDAWHVDVGQNGVHPLAAKQGQGLLAIAGFEAMGEFEPGEFDDAAHEGPHRGRIVGDQDAIGH